MDITTIPRSPGARKRRKRVGRGIGSGHGKTSTRGQKGQRARTGSGKRPGFEGGQTPLIRRIPKRGMRRKATGFTSINEIVNVAQLDRFESGQRVTPELLREAGLLRDLKHRIKLLGDGAVSKRLTVVVHGASESAVSKIQQAGGTVELIKPSDSKIEPRAQSGG
jgi:large subunit ribosomal protein L15